MLYFAYGSNMNLLQMRFRCRTARFIGAGLLKQYKLVEREFADIDFAPGSIVHGALFEIRKSDLIRLDRYEGYPNLYRRHIVTVEIGMYQVKAIVYQMTVERKKQLDGIPFSPSYREICSNGAVLCRLPVNFYEVAP